MQSLSSDNWGMETEKQGSTYSSVTLPPRKKKGVCVLGLLPCQEPSRTAADPLPLSSAVPSSRLRHQEVGTSATEKRRKKCIEFCSYSLLFFPLLLFQVMISESVALTPWSAEVCSGCCHLGPLLPERKSLKTFAKSQPPFQAPLPSLRVYLSFAQTDL